MTVVATAAVATAMGVDSAAEVRATAALGAVAMATAASGAVEKGWAAAGLGLVARMVVVGERSRLAR